MSFRSFLLIRNTDRRKLQRGGVHRRKIQKSLRFEALEARQLFAILTVTSTADSGAGTLRAALELANANADADEIRFNLSGSGVQTISLQTELPWLDSPVTIDGWSQPGFSSAPLIKLADGASVDYGLQIIGENSTVRGLIFSGFDNSHLAIWGGDNNKVQGSYFGTNNAGSALDGLPTAFDAIFIGDGSTGNVIGVDGDGVSDSIERNTIGGSQSGIGVWGADTTGNRISGNYIGTNVGLADLGNSYGGVWFDQGANGNVVGSNNNGGGDSAEGNIIMYNGTSGIVVNGNDTQQNTFSRNIVRNNDFFQIDLGNDGHTANDLGDADTGPNGRSNYPDLTFLDVGPGGFTVAGELGALASEVYRVEFFAVQIPSPSGYGGAQRYLGAGNITTDATGKSVFSFAYPVQVDYGWMVTATATDSNGNTSELSAPIWAGTDLRETFQLSSRPTANHTIYLDFNGHTTTGTEWNSSTGVGTIVTPAFSLDANPAFSNEELLRIQNIYQRVVEDFRPFNVNVTTAQPALADLIKEGSSDTRWGVRVAIGGSWEDWYGSPAGGVGYLTSFNWNSDTPAFVFPSVNNNSDAALVADTISHEVGHTLGLTHDGSPGNEYYPGHGTGDTAWNTIMGGGGKALTQWSKGEYLNANNSQDDLLVITTQNGFGYVADDSPASTVSAPPLGNANGKILQKGVISTRSDVDWFFFETSGGAIDLRFGPAILGANLDIMARLRDASGTIILSNNPTTVLTARLATTLAAGRYFVSVDGIGVGNPVATGLGYTDYASLGEYAITGVINGLNQAPLLSSIAGNYFYTNNSGASIAFAGAAVVTDPNSLDFNGGRLTISITNAPDASNRIILSGTQFTKSGSNLMMGSTIIGTYNSSGVGTSNFAVTFNANATASIIQQLLRSLRFRTFSNTNMASRVINVSLTDGDGGTSNMASVGVFVV